MSIYVVYELAPDFDAVRVMSYDEADAFRGRPAPWSTATGVEVTDAVSFETVEQVNDRSSSMIIDDKIFGACF
jgi:hypothetical protein